MANKIQRTSATTREFTLEFLEQITDNFSKEHVIGSGGYGVVYKVYSYAYYLDLVTSNDTTVQSCKGSCVFVTGGTGKRGRACSKKAPLHAWA